MSTRACNDFEDDEEGDYPHKPQSEAAAWLADPRYPHVNPDTMSPTQGGQS